MSEPTRPGDAQPPQPVPERPAPAAACADVHFRGRTGHLRTPMSSGGGGRLMC
jgi:hypothetical protein